MTIPEGERPACQDGAPSVPDLVLTDDATNVRRSEASGNPEAGPVAFVQDIFGDAVSTERQLVIFGLAGEDRSRRLIRWCPSIEVAKVAIDEVGAQGDVYFSCSLQDAAAALAEARRRAEAKGEQPPGLDQTRGFSSTARTIGGPWLDFDVAGPGHKKANLPPTIDAALEIIDALPHAPTYVLNSGGGLHCWWLFKEPWVFEADQERALAARIVHGWQCLARDLCAKRGWALDSTHSLAQVLRLPGTVNRKYGRAVEVIR